MDTPTELSWDESLSTGDMEIDAQHRYLIDIFNDLGRAMGEDYSADDLDKVLRVMEFYADWHFGKEETCMAKYHCPVAEKNKKAHAVFIEKSKAYRLEFEKSKGSRELALKIHKELSDWIINHILAVDTKLYPCIHPKSASKVQHESSNEETLK